jgi:hypothetical protein
MILLRSTLLLWLAACTAGLHSLDLVPVRLASAPRELVTNHYQLAFEPEPWTNYSTEYRVGLGPDCQGLGPWTQIDESAAITLDSTSTFLSYKLKSSTDRESPCFSIALVRRDLVALTRSFEFNEKWGTWMVPVADAGNNTTPCSPTVPLKRNACVHAGEAFQATIVDSDSCEGIAARDTLGAFEWVCEDLGSSIRISTTRLKIDRGLGDLISGFEFKDNALWIDGPGWGRRSVQPLTWKNSIVPIPTTGPGDAIDLSGAGNIFVAESPVVAPGYRILSPNVSVVALPGASISATPSGGDNCNGNTGPDGAPNLRCLISSNSPYFWIEGALGLAGTENGLIYAPGSDYGVVKNLQMLTTPSQYVAYFWGSVLRGENLRAVYPSAQTQGWGFLFSGGSYNVISRVRANNVFSAALSIGCLSCWVEDVEIANSRSNSANASALQISLSTNVRASRIRIVNPVSQGVRIFRSSRVVIQDLVVAGSGSDGVSILGNVGGISESIRIQNAHLSNNLDEGVSVDRSEGVLIQNTGIYNNTSAGVSLTETAVLIQGLQLASVRNARGISWTASSDIARPMELHGEFLVGNSDTCLPGVNSVAGFDSSCNPVAPSTATGILQNPATPAWRSKLSERDSVNQSPNQTMEGLITPTSATDWFDFENPFRILYLNASNLFVIGARGPSSASPQSIWDLSLLASSWLKRQPAQASGNCTAPLDVVHSFDNVVSGLSTPINGLAYAVERLDDDIGNHNGICEAGEECLYTPNIGPYQGHGELKRICSNPGTGGAWDGTGIWSYTSNGI